MLMIFEGAHALMRFGRYVQMSIPAQFAVALRAGLQEIGQLVAAQARAELGFYQPARGAYPTWAPLAPSTLEQKARLGQTGRRSADDPLIATGAFLDDIFFQVHLPTASVAIGTTKDYILYTELGTSKMPPRPVFGPAVLASGEAIKRIAVGVAAFGLVGEGFSFSELTSMSPIGRLAASIQG